MTVTATANSSKQQKQVIRIMLEVNRECAAKLLARSQKERSLEPRQCERESELMFDPVGTAERIDMNTRIQWHFAVPLTGEEDATVVFLSRKRLDATHGMPGTDNEKFYITNMAYAHDLTSFYIDFTKRRSYSGKLIVSLVEMFIDDKVNTDYTEQGDDVTKEFNVIEVTAENISGIKHDNPELIEFIDEGLMTVAEAVVNYNLHRVYLKHMTFSQWKFVFVKIGHVLKAGRIKSEAFKVYTPGMSDSEIKARMYQKTTMDLKYNPIHDDGTTDYMTLNRETVANDINNNPWLIERQEDHYGLSLYDHVFRSSDVLHRDDGRIEFVDPNFRLTKTNMVNFQSGKKHWLDETDLGKIEPYDNAPTDNSPTNNSPTNNAPIDGNEKKRLWRENNFQYMPFNLRTNNLPTNDMASSITDSPFDVSSAMNNLLQFLKDNPENPFGIVRTEGVDDNGQEGHIDIMVNGQIDGDDIDTQYDIVPQTKLTSPVTPVTQFIPTGLGFIPLIGDINTDGIEGAEDNAPQSMEITDFDGGVRSVEITPISLGMIFTPYQHTSEYVDESTDPDYNPELGESPSPDYDNSNDDNSNDDNSNDDNSNDDNSNDDNSNDDNSNDDNSNDDNSNDDNSNDDNSNDDNSNDDNSNDDNSNDNGND